MSSVLICGRGCESRWLVVERRELDELVLVLRRLFVVLLLRRGCGMSGPFGRKRSYDPLPGERPRKRLFV